MPLCCPLDGRSVDVHGGVPGAGGETKHQDRTGEQRRCRHQRGNEEQNHCQDRRPRQHPTAAVATRQASGREHAGERPNSEGGQCKAQSLRIDLQSIGYGRKARHP